HTWKLNSAKDGFVHNLNIYSDTAYYFLTIGNAPGQRVSTAPVVSGTPGATITTYNDRRHHEEERKNLLNSGRVWYGEEFNAYNLSRSVTFQNLDGLDPNGTAKLTSAVLGISPV